MNRYNFLSKNASSFGNQRRSTFARAASRSAFGNRWAEPDNDNFRDRDPGERRSVAQHPKTWHRLGDVAADVLRGLIREDDGNKAA